MVWKEQLRTKIALALPPQILHIGLVKAAMGSRVTYVCVFKQISNVIGLGANDIHPVLICESPEQHTGGPENNGALPVNSMLGLCSLHRCSQVWQLVYKIIFRKANHHLIEWVVKHKRNLQHPP